MYEHIYGHSEAATSVRVEINDKYYSLHRWATLRRLLGAIMKRPSSLRNLAAAMDGYRICGQHDEGLQVVPLRYIVGSEGRCNDFDCAFRPLKTHTQQRWFNVARAYLSGVNLPPVALIRVGDAYYVRDGNHRVSVAKAFGQLDIEALVTEYQVTPRTMLEGLAAVGA